MIDVGPNLYLVVAPTDGSPASFEANSTLVGRRISDTIGADVVNGASVICTTDIATLALAQQVVAKL